MPDCLESASCLSLLTFAFGIASPFFLSTLALALAASSPRDGPVSARTFLVGPCPRAKSVVVAVPLTVGSGCEPPRWAC